MIKIYGKVIHGKKYGRVLGFPTANIDRRQYVRGKIKVKLGVWAGWAEQELSIKNQVLRKHKAAIVIGPIDTRGLPKLEAHLINFKGNLYDKKISLTLSKFVRPFKEFKTEAELKRQIALDVARIKKL